jgi:putative heme-binding domain-containing protein
MRCSLLVLAAILGVAPAAPAQNDPPRLKLQKGDRISIIGNTLADRMQHDGWLETLLQARFPDHELVIRNLGYPGDEIDLKLRLRSASFGTPDQWLTKTQAGVVFAFFGYNESFGGAAGLDKFRKDLADFIQHALQQKYDGASAPRLVLFGPIAHENLRDRNLPDGAENNKRLEIYSQAMAEVARANGVLFVDLFAPSLKLYAAAPRPLTLNGIHLNEEGNKALAGVIDRALFGEPAAARESAALDKLNGAVREKNFTWFHRYRTTDGYSTYGGRADLKFVEGQTNRVVLQRELEILDAMTANRDRRIWAAARGGDLDVDDAATPDFVPVRSNKPGPGPGGAHDFLPAELAIGRMQVARGMKVNLFASEETFPELANPVQMAWDARGRLWVAAWPNYPHWKPKTAMSDKLLILEDTNGDGKADVCKTFVGDLNNPTGFDFYNGGVIVAQCPDILFLKDTNGDDKADVRERLVNGMDSADTHHQSNSFVIDPGGAFYWQEGTFHHTQVETPYGPPQRCANAGVFRYHPRIQKFEVYVSYGFANPHGHVFDRWGQDFVTDGTGAETYYALTFNGHVDFPRKHAKPPKPYQQRTRPCPGTEILSSRHFPDEMQGNLLVANVIGFQGILQYRFEDKDSAFKATETEVIVQSSDPNFRPSDLEIGPDGAIYFTDWHNPIIGHMQHNLRDPSRDRIHGRVYRVTYMDRPLLKPAPISGEPIEKLLELLKEPEDRVRYRARIELGGRKTDDVIAAVKKWAAGLDPKDKEFHHHLLEALWMHQYHNVVDLDLLGRVLRSPDPRARAAATRVLRWWSAQVPDALALLKVQANDEHPRVRLEALVAAADFAEPGAAIAALEVLKQKRDEAIDFCLKETMATLKPYWESALKAGTLELPADNPAAVDYLVGNVGAADLKKLPKSAGVHLAILTRHGVAMDARRDALRELAKAKKAEELPTLLDVIAQGVGGEHAAHVLEDLGRLLLERPAAELKGSRDRLKMLAQSGSSPETRQIGCAAWVTADGSADDAFAATAKSPRDFLDAVRLIPDAKIRESLYARVRPLLYEAPTGPGPASRGLKVDFISGVPENAALETLAAMKVRRSGVASEISLEQKIIEHRDRFALRFTGSIHIPKDGDYTFSIASDDGSRLYLDGRLAVDNDGNHGLVEKSGTLKLKAGPHAIAVTYFDSGGDDGLSASWQGPGFAKERIPGHVLGTEAVDSALDAVIGALEAIPGHEKEKFADFAGLVQSGRNRGAAVRAIRRTDKSHWDAALARPLVNAILAWAQPLPASERTQPQVVDGLQLGQELAALLPADQAGPARTMLKNLDVAVILIRPVPHQMVFDRRKIVVEAGKPVEIVFDNIDIMPHNFVVTAPGAMAEVGQAAEKMGLEGQAKDYLPDTPKLLWATKLVMPGENRKLQFTAPRQTGNYPYVCTFPGHWLVMNGVMQVVEAGAVTTLTDAPAAPATPSRPFVRMWTLKDLEDDVKAMSKGRSFARGKEMFTAAGCVKCHVIAGEGGKIGPDLSKVAEKYKGVLLVRQIVEPSTEINEQFRSFLLATEEDAFAGLIVKEDDKAYHVLTNPNDPADLTVVPKAKVKAKKALDLSTMPTGLLTTLQKEEILDLAAFVEAGGDPKHAYFKK